MSAGNCDGPSCGRRKISNKDRQFPWKDGSSRKCGPCLCTGRPRNIRDLIQVHLQDEDQQGSLSENYDRRHPAGGNFQEIDPSTKAGVWLLNSFALSDEISTLLAASSQLLRDCIRTVRSALTRRPLFSTRVFGNGRPEL